MNTTFIFSALVIFNLREASTSQMWQIIDCLSVCGGHKYMSEAAHGSVTFSHR